MSRVCTVAVCRPDGDGLQVKTKGQGALLDEGGGCFSEANEGGAVEREPHGEIIKGILPRLSLSMPKSCLDPV